MNARHQTRLLLSLGTVPWLLLPAITAHGQDLVRVSTPEELVRSIASERTIVLEQGEYYLSEAEGIYTEHVAWEETFDGPQLLVRDVENLTIRSEQGATILTEPRYSYVLSFVDCRAVNLDYLAISHTEAGYCIGGVVRLERCEQVTLQSCGLFGSGTVGIDIIDSFGVRVRDSTISECTYGAVWIQASAEVIFTDVEISGNEAWPLIDIGESSGIVFEYCWIGYNYGDAMFSVDEYSDSLFFEAVTFEGNESDFLAYDRSRLPDLFTCVFTDNTFTDQMIDETDDLGYDPDYAYPEENDEYIGD